MSQLENCIRGLHGRSVALNLTNRQFQKNSQIMVASFQIPTYTKFIESAFGEMEWLHGYNL